MEKNRIRPIATGKNMRMSYSRQEEVLEMPNLIEVQKDSYKWFLDEGLKEVFEDISPIEDYSGHLSLEFVDFELCEDDVKYSIEKCKERDATYAAPLKVKVRLYNKEKEEISEHEIFMGDLPIMTETGTFVINGAERVIVSQLVRSPGIYYGIGHDKICLLYTSGIPYSTLVTALDRGIEGMAYGTVIRMCDKLSLNPVDFSSLEKGESLGERILENRVMQYYVLLNKKGRKKILEMMEDYSQLDKYKEQ